MIGFTEKTLVVKEFGAAKGLSEMRFVFGAIITVQKNLHLKRSCFF